MPALRRAERSKAGAAIKARPAPAAPAIKRRRVRWSDKDLFGMIDLRISLAMDQYMSRDFMTF